MLPKNVHKMLSLAESAIKDPLKEISLQDRRKTVSRQINLAETAGDSKEVARLQIESDRLWLINMMVKQGLEAGKS